MGHKYPLTHIDIQRLSHIDNICSGGELVVYLERVSVERYPVSVDREPRSFRWRRFRGFRYLLVTHYT